MIEDNDIEYYDSTMGMTTGKQFTLAITRLTEKEIIEIKKDILINQKLRKIIEDSVDFFDGRYTEVIGRLCKRMLEDAKK